MVKKTSHMAPLVLQQSMGLTLNPSEKWLTSTSKLCLRSSRVGRMMIEAKLVWRPILLGSSLCDFQVVTYLNLCFSFYETQRVKSIYARVFQPVNTSICIPRLLGFADTALFANWSFEVTLHCQTVSILAIKYFLN